MAKTTEIEDHNRLLREACVEGDPNRAWRYDFGRMSKLYGKAFIDMIKACWQGNGGCLSEEEFIAYHGIPRGFFDKVIAGR